MKKPFNIRIVFIVLLAIFLAVTFALFMFGERILIYAAPKMVLSSALNKTFSQLEERSDGNPLLILLKVLDWEGKYHTALEAEFSDELLGEIRYDMIVNADAGTHRLLAEGTVASLQQNLDVTVYLDDEYMALSSDDLLKGSFYGITYDSFSSDIHSFPLIEYLIPAATIQEWDNSVAKIQQAMNRSYELPQLPDISKEAIDAMTLGIMAFPSRITGEELMINGEAVPCRKISYSTSGIQTEGLPPNATVAVDFYLSENRLVMASADITANDKETSVSLLLGEDLLTCPILMQYTDTEGGIYRNYVVSVSTERNNDVYYENWNIHKTEGREEESISFSYAYNTESGDMELTIGQEAPAEFRLTETENGIFIKSEDIFGLFRSMNQEKTDVDSKKVSCTLELRAGSSVAAPAYKNLDMWSMDDLLVLLGGIGSLLGINIE